MSANSQLSLHDSVLGWLDNLSTLQHVSQKRARPLSELHVNIMSNASNHDGSPAQKRRKHPETQQDMTPRPIRLPHSVSTSRSSQSTTSARSKSPVKRMGDLLLNPEPIVQVSFYDENAVMPPGLENTVLEMKRIARGYQVIPESCRADILSRPEKAFRDIKGDKMAFCADDALLSFGPVPPASAVAKVHRLAGICEANTHYEADWNCRVHSYLLDMAIDNDKFLGHVGFLNCSSASIEPKSLAPPSRWGQPLESKMVDFAIHLNADGEMLDRFRALAAAEDEGQASFSINHTRHIPLRHQPICVNIETKLTGVDWDTALVQVSIWVAAQFARLEQLVLAAGGDTSDLPPWLPIIVIQGHGWTFLAATRNADRQMCLWNKVEFGNTLDPLGIYQIVAGVQMLANWAQMVYRPWFRRYAMGIVDEVLVFGD